MKSLINNEELKKSSLHSSMATKSHLHVMIATNAKEEAPKKDKPSTKYKYKNPYYHPRKSHMHILIKDENDNEGPQNSQEDIHMTSLQIMISPNVKDEPHQFQQSTQVFPKIPTHYNPYDHVNKPHTHLLMTSNDQDKGPNYYQQNTNMTPLQIMINPNVKDDQSLHLEQKKSEYKHELFTNHDKSGCQR